jgi:hypothetical protein
MAKTEATIRRLVPERFSEKGWEPYGWVPKADTDPNDGRDRLAYDWGDPHVNLISHTLDEVPHRPGVLSCNELFHHRTHTQVLMALDHPCVIVVAPATAAVGGEQGIDGVGAFLLEPLEPLVLAQATWHWGPYPSATEKVTLFNVQGLRYAEDNDRLDLSELGLGLEVEIGSSGGR